MTVRFLVGFAVTAGGAAALVRGGEDHFNAVAAGASVHGVVSV